MGVSAMEPVNTRDPSTALRAYIALGWRLTLGHRYRPRQGCTCQNTNCPAPGAHPLLEPLPPLTAATADSALQTAPGAALIAATTHFDAVIVPSRIGMAAMTRLDTVTPVPCLLRDDQAVLLVLPATGRYALVHPDVVARTGPDGWLALPPSRDVRWDTPPWMEAVGTPHRLLHGSDVGRYLAEAFNAEAVNLSPLARNESARGNEGALR
ncbi:hypothetical protein OG352_39830 (plasmid) [Streptomyces sp. NBC_01485]|uniref:hypothetical protein n=1 Tax=Streptomyces sp. NBC_01485 TaxID=2903884 RepID=UPI002E2FEAE4|nr:hypothetical protein [Streptomyces sp. NBC_01485]